MSITIQLDLPDSLVEEAKSNGLLGSASIGDLLTAELRRRRAAGELNDVLKRIRPQSGKPISEEELAAEIEAMRRERRVHEVGY